MPLDPSISLQVQPVGLNQAPFDIMNKMASFQGQMQSNYLQKQGIAARQALGKLMATAPDIETGIKAGLQDPNIAAFAPEALQGLASLQQTLQTTKGLEQTQSQSGLESFFKILPMAATDPSKIDGLIEAQASAMPDGPAKDSFVKGAKTIQKGLTANYDPKRPESIASVQQQMAGLLTSYGAAPISIPNPDGSSSPGISVGGVPVKMTPQGGQGEQGTDVGGHEGFNGEAPAGGIRTPSLSEAETQKTTASQVMDMQKEINATQDVLPQTVNRLQNVAKTLQAFQAGAGSEVRMNAQRAIQGLRDIGIPVPKALQEKFGTDDLTNGQLFEQEVGNFAISNLSQVQKGLGEASAMELNNAINQFSTTRDPKMLYHALDFADQQLRMQQDKANRWAQTWEATGGDPNKMINFPSINSKLFSAHGIETPSHLPDISTIRTNDDNFSAGGAGGGGEKILKDPDTGKRYRFKGGDSKDPKNYEEVK